MSPARRLRVVRLNGAGRLPPRQEVPTPAGGGCEHWGVGDSPDLTRVPDDVLALAVADAVRAVDQQAAKLTEHRGRAAAILGAASIVASFLGSEALQRLDGAGGRMEPDLHVVLGTAVGLLAFVVVAVLVCFALRPTAGWAFVRSPRKLIPYIADPRTADAHAYRRFTLLDLADDHTGNDEKLRPLTRAVRVSVYALALETLGFLVALL